MLNVHAFGHLADRLLDCTVIEHNRDTSTGGYT